MTIHKHLKKILTSQPLFQLERTADPSDFKTKERFQVSNGGNGEILYERINYYRTETIRQRYKDNEGFIIPVKSINPALTDKEKSKMIKSNLNEAIKKGLVNLNDMTKIKKRMENNKYIDYFVFGFTENFQI